jgi:hypothetical protein
MSAVPQGLNMAANAVANPTNTRTSKGMNVRIPVSALPRSGVTFVETQEIGVAS